MAQTKCSVTMIAGRTHPRRGVALLEHPTGYVNAKAVFESLGTSSKRYHRKSFDYWMNDPYKAKPERYHGFKKSYYSGKYVWNFTFKNIEEKERFYGFLCNPKKDDPGYQLCVLTGYAQKKEDAQDLTELDRVEKMRKDPNVKDALSDPRLFTTEDGMGKNYDD
jgi:hypothetical protein